MYITSLVNILVLLAMAIPGFIITKLKLIDTAKVCKFISIMLLYVCHPFIAFNSFLNNDFDISILTNILVVVAFTIVFTLIMLLIAHLAHFWEKDRDRKALAVYGSAMSNLGFMCIPFLQILMPDDTLVTLYASTAVVAFNLVAWTVGNYIITGEVKYVKFKKAVLNPPMLSFLLVLPLFIFNINFIQFPELTAIQTMCDTFAGIVGPLAMTMLGIRLAGFTFNELFGDWKLYVSAGIKLIISPCVAFGLVALLATFYDISGIRLNLIVMCTMPTATNMMMFTTMYNKDTVIAGKISFMSAVLSVITIPIALTLFL